MARSQQHRAVNIWGARLIPVLLFAYAVYATYVMIGPVCINYFVHAPPTRSSRPGAAGVILVLFFIFEILTAISFFRIDYAVFQNPGFIERSKAWKRREREKRLGRDGRRKSDTEKSKEKDGEVTRGTPYLGPPQLDTEQPELDYLYDRDVYECEADGRPRWCPVCLSWKPDRTHHCGEIDRCVRKMDHFCPWVGGIVSITNFKFFFQFLFWTMTLCLVAIISCAVVLGEMRADGAGSNGQVIAVLVVCSFFALFTGGLCGSSLQMILMNTTSVEILSYKVKVTSLAVYLPNVTPETVDMRFRWIALPLNTSTSTKRDSRPPRVYAILHSQKGERPYNLTPSMNFKSVMGLHWYDWLLPLRYSPCADINWSATLPPIHELNPHELPKDACLRSDFPPGPAFYNMLKREDLIEDVFPSHRRRSSRSRRRSSTSARRPSGSLK